MPRYVFPSGAPAANALPKASAGAVTTAPIRISCTTGGASFFLGTGFLAFVVVFFFFFFGFLGFGGGISSSPPSEDLPSPVGSEPASDSGGASGIDRTRFGGSGAQSGVSRSASGIASISAGMTVSLGSTSPDGALCSVLGRGTLSQASAIDGAPSGRSAQLGCLPMLCPGEVGNWPGEGRPAQLGSRPTAPSAAPGGPGDAGTPPQLGWRLAAGGASLTSSSKMPRKDSFIMV
mmetsp:Transcript_17521/g.51903  ORF Transcript_17521/g.51903 Transcript_17521/m.51903 type:complete len:234 (+) Transcript_17521:316-1017(+)